MTEADARSLSSSRKRRGVVRASLTRLRNRLSELETLDSAKQLLARLDALDQDFRVHHLAIVDLTDGEENLGLEQEALDKHDDEVAQLGIHVQQLIATCSSSPDSSPRKIANKRLLRLQRALAEIGISFAKLTGDPDSVCLLRQYSEQLVEFKTELSDVRNCLFALDLDDSDELSKLLDDVEKTIFDRSLEVKKRLVTHSLPTAVHAPDAKGVKLPKLDVPSFDGNILHWKTFWEQFTVSIHARTSLSNAEKLVYLQHVLKDGTAKRVIEGLSGSGDNYAEEVECLRALDTTDHTSYTKRTFA